jgi:hypothetical protein
MPRVMSLLNGFLAMFDGRLTSLETQVADLQLRLRHQGEQQARERTFAVDAIVNLRSSLERLIGGDARDLEVNGELVVFTLTPVHVTLNAFSRTVELASAIATARPVDSLVLQFDEEGHLSTEKVMLVLGFIQMLTSDVESTRFWPLQASA